MLSPPTLISARDYDKEHCAEFVERLCITQILFYIKIISSFSKLGGRGSHG